MAIYNQVSQEKNEQKKNMYRERVKEREKNVVGILCD